MDFSIQSGQPDQHTYGCLVVGVYEAAVLTPSAKIIDQLSEGYLSQLLQQGDMRGKLGQVLMLHRLPNLKSERVLLVGCGPEKPITMQQYQTLIGSMLAALNQAGAAEVKNFLTEIAVENRNHNWKVRLSVEIIHRNLYVFDQLKSEKETLHRPIRQFVFQIEKSDDTKLAKQALIDGSAIAKGMNLCRDVANLPANICNPAYLSEQALALVDLSDKVDVQLFDEQALQDLNMQSYLAVGQGSENESVMSVIEYKGAQNKQDKPIVLIGKGITFDSGGISLKPGAGMDEMKYDMGGAAGVLGTMRALIDLDLPINVIGILAGCENMPDGSSYRPGDVITTMSGQTVEVLNTDAEGRMVLCDVLTFVERYNPDVVIDTATLTGACIIALGHHACALMSNHDPLAQDLLRAGQDSGDRAWQLPLWEDYQEQIRSPFADMANIGGKAAGSITAAAFLSRFAKPYQWAHLDVAGTAWVSGAKKGATGRPVPILTQYLITRANACN
jgi:leucyl aminopeptidase